MNDCNKIPFNTAEEARGELERIVENNTYKSWKRVTPSRIYQCGCCFKWHLTSKISITY